MEPYQLVDRVACLEVSEARLEGSPGLGHCCSSISKWTYSRGDFLVYINFNAITLLGASELWAP